MTSLAGNSTFAITDAKPYAPIVTLSIEENAKLTKLLSTRFKRSVYWNKYKVIPNKIYNQNNYIRELLDSSYQGEKRLFILSYDNTDDNPVRANSHRRHFLLRIKIENYNIAIDGRSFYDQLINDLKLSNTMKLEKYQQDKVMIILQAVYWILLISKKIID